MSDGYKSKLRKSISKWANSDDEDARHLRRTHRDDSCVSIADAPDRERVRLRGTLRTVTLSPAAEPRPWRPSCTTARAC